MPIYEYKRPDGSTFDVMQSFSEDPLTHDPDTGVEVQRVLHAPAVHFKGSGFYNTDYGTRRRQRENASTSEGSSGESSSGTEAGASTEKTDSSAGTKSEPASDKSSAKPEPKAGSKVSSAVGAS